MTVAASSLDKIARRLNRRLRWVGAAIFLERLTRLAWPTISLVLLFIALTALGLPERLTDGLHTVFQLVFAAALTAALWRLRSLRLPTRQECGRRLETDHHLAHRPVSVLTDHSASSSSDPLTDALWRRHKRNTLIRLARLSLNRPHPVLPSADPWGLRFLPLLLLAIAMASGGLSTTLPHRLAKAVTPNFGLFLGPPAQIQVWLTPPAYTHLAPRPFPTADTQTAVSVPAGSHLLIHLQGGWGHATALVDDEEHPLDQLGEGSQKGDITIASSNRLTIRQGWRTIAQWPLATVADHPPDVTFSSAPQADPQGRLKLDIQAHDDYGVTKLWLLVIPPANVHRPVRTIPLPLSGDAMPDTRLSLWQDLTDDPLAGQTVSLQLAVEDGAEQRALSALETLRLPERTFINPVAQRIIALRRMLLKAPADRAPIIAGLTAITWDLPSYHGDLHVFLPLSVAASRLRWDDDDTAVDSVAYLLWQTALRLEDGDRPDAEHALTQAQKALEDALSQPGTSAAEITARMQDLQKALDRYLDSVVQDAVRHGFAPVPSDSDRPMVNAQELQSMIEQMQSLAETGSRQGALDMLRQLQQLTDSLHSIGRAPPPANSQKIIGLMTALTDITGTENRLLDETFQENRKQQEASEQEGMGVLGQSQGPNPSPRPLSTPEAATRQETVRQKLVQTLGQLQELGMDSPQPFSQAEQAMRDAADALSQNNLPDAVDSQTEAVSRLQEGLSKLQKSLSQKLGSGLSLPIGQDPNRDPLGRPLSPSSNPGGDSPDFNKLAIPNQSDQQRARSVLEELRRRANDSQSTPEERDYLHRLLQKIF